jgi:hypothetical protein
MGLSDEEEEVKEEAEEASVLGVVKEAWLLTARRAGFGRCWFSQGFGNKMDLASSATGFLSAAGLLSAEDKDDGEEEGLDAALCTELAAVDAESLLAELTAEPELTVDPAVLLFAEEDAEEEPEEEEVPALTTEAEAERVNEEEAGAEMTDPLDPIEYLDGLFTSGGRFSAASASRWLCSKRSKACALSLFCSSLSLESLSFTCLSSFSSVV